MELFSNKKGIRKAKEAAGGQQHATIIANEAAAAQRARDMASEEAKARVWSMLGQSPENLFNKDFQNTRNIDDPNSLFDRSGLGYSQPDQNLRGLGPNDASKNSVLGNAREGILDPDAYANMIAGTKQFAIQSRALQKAESLMNREGEDWNRLKQATYGLIHEGIAAAHAENMDALKTAYAKGGAARNAAKQGALESQLRMDSMTRRVNEGWRASLALEDTINKNMAFVQQSNQMFMDNLPLVNSGYRDAQRANTSMMIEAAKFTAEAVGEAYDTKMTQQPQNFGENLLEGVIQMAPKIVGSFFGPVGSAVGGAMSDVIGGARGQGGYTARGTSPSEEEGGGGGLFGGGMPDFGAIGDAFGTTSLGGKLNSWMDGNFGSVVEGTAVPMAPGS